MGGTFSAKSQLGTFSIESQRGVFSDKTRPFTNWIKEMGRANVSWFKEICPEFLSQENRERQLLEEKAEQRRLTREAQMNAKRQSVATGTTYITTHGLVHCRYSTRCNSCNRYRLHCLLRATYIATGVVFRTVSSESFLTHSFRAHQRLTLCYCNHGGRHSTIARWSAKRLKCLGGSKCADKN